MVSTKKHQYCISCLPELRNYIQRWERENQRNVNVKNVRDVIIYLYKHCCNKSLEKTIMDFFESVPNDILLIILNFVVLFQDFSKIQALALKLVCKRWKSLITGVEEESRNKSLEFWTSSGHEVENLEWVQKEFEKTWPWFYYQFINNFLYSCRMGGTKIGKIWGVKIHRIHSSISCGYYNDDFYMNGLGTYVNKEFR
jgi:hypothetical protein